ncbi:DEAD/DEAH box helicase [Ruminococcus sp.]|uniref:DEAD/DEAH box helicase n=1 Tax=Ruminococcus sp. TaxID=41978 RepID=UPI0025ED2E47|nr:DEAD/DEAH box helicase [Ruminococcus sp.]
MKLHDYQEYAVKFVEEHPVSALLLDMGLGKTIITLTAINNLMFDMFEVRKVLIIAPLRVARDTWPAEIEKWEHLKHLRYSVVIGTPDERKAALNTDADIYITNRENVDWLVSNTTFDYDMVVIDELSSFKNYQSKRFKALMKVRPNVKRIVGLTGTPASNGLMDLFAEFRLLDMGERLGRFIGQYRNEYFRPDKQNGYIVYSYKPLPDAEERIYEKISDITVSMKAVDHLKMPELISNKYTVKMSEAEKEKYKELKDELILEVQDTEITVANAAALSNKLCQMSNGAIYDDSGEIIPIHNRKLDALEDIIESANGKPVLVAYWFKHDRTRIAEKLNKLGIVYQEIKSAESIKSWNSGKLPVALIHPASSGHGLNLQSGGNFLVWFGLTWSLELYQQTNARLWRQGQQSETVIIQHIVTKGTVDERILKALKEKDETQTALMTAVKAEMEE